MDVREAELLAGLLADMRHIKAQLRDGSHAHHLMSQLEVPLDALVGHCSLLRLVADPVQTVQSEPEPIRLTQPRRDRPAGISSVR